VFRLEFEREANEYQVREWFDDHRTSYHVLEEMERRQASDRETSVQNSPDGGIAADGPQVPGEGQDVFPETVFVEESYERDYVLVRNTSFERGEPLVG